MMTVLPRLQMAIGAPAASRKSTRRRKLLAAISEMHRSLWLLECNLKQKDRLALLASLETTADEIDRLLT